VCFSASASFIASGTTGLFGVATLRKVRASKEIPLASAPLLFGVQQLIEGVVWLSFQEPRMAAWNGIATYAYSLFSHVLWPVFVPFAVLLFEPDGTRRKILVPLLALGALVSVYLLAFVVFDPVTSEVVNHSIRYNYHHHYPTLTMLLYLVAVCASCLASSFPLLRFFGMALGTAFAVAYVMYIATFFSVWCFFGAALSVVLYFHFRWRGSAVHPSNA
jgi:hypothetical protein